MLGMMERFPLSQFGPFDPQSWHLKIEAQKLAYQDLSRFIADPRHVKTPTKALFDKQYLAARAQLIDPRKANANPGPGKPPLDPRGDTTYLAVVDDDGNMISLIQSIYQSFGSGIAVEPFGFHLHNRGALFSLDPQHPNALAPRKRPFHTIIPGLLEGGGKAIAFGIMGGLNQAQAHAQFVSYVVDHQMNLQQALDAPRFSKYTFSGCDVRVESRFPEAARKALALRGHLLTVQGAYSHAEMGSGQAVMLDLKTNMKSAASDPRKDGWAIPAVP
jgi:gamma-glutamyltranspeptidase/glutathione hydrolase